LGRLAPRTPGQLASRELKKALAGTPDQTAAPSPTLDRILALLLQIEAKLDNLLELVSK